MPVKLQRRYECDECGAVEDAWAAPGVPDHEVAPEGWQVRPLSPSEPFKVFCASKTCTGAYESQAEAARQARIKIREEAKRARVEREEARRARKEARRATGDES